MENSPRVPKGWFVTGDAPDKYEIGIDPEVTHDGHPCVSLKACPDPAEFAALAQAVKADLYHGKRLRFSAAVRSMEVENRAALFMRISGANGKMLAFDNMRSRPITGTTDWKSYEIVLDVSKEAEDIIFGVLLSLKGQVWVACVALDVVDEDIPSTDMLEEIASYIPVNLTFDE